MLSGITRVEELMLTPEEATQFAGALAEVNKFYNLEVAAKTVAWVNLSVVAGMIYGPRLIAYRVNRGQRTQTRRAEPQAAQQQNAAPTPDVATSMADAVPEEFMATGGMGLSAPIKWN